MLILENDYALSGRLSWDFCELESDEVEAIAEHEHVPIIVAAELGCGLPKTEDGLAVCMSRCLDDIQLCAPTTAASIHANNWPTPTGTSGALACKPPPSEDCAGQTGRAPWPPFGPRSPLLVSISWWRGMLGDDFPARSGE